MLHETVDQLCRTVMAKAEPLRKRAHGGTSSLGHSFDGEQELVLLRFDAFGPGCFFAHMQELADAVTEFGKLAVARSRNISAVYSRLNAVVTHNHFSVPAKSIVSRWKVCVSNAEQIYTAYVGDDPYGQ
jgi:hypothetical protein